MTLQVAKQPSSFVRLGPFVFRPRAQRVRSAAAVLFQSTPMNSIGYGLGHFRLCGNVRVCLIDDWLAAPYSLSCKPRSGCAMSVEIISE